MALTTVISLSINVKRSRLISNIPPCYGIATFVGKVVFMSHHICAC